MHWKYIEKYNVNQRKLKKWWKVTDCSRRKVQRKFAFDAQAVFSQLETLVATCSSAAKFYLKKVSVSLCCIKCFCLLTVNERDWMEESVLISKFCTMLSDWSDDNFSG